MCSTVESRLSACVQLLRADTFYVNIPTVFISAGCHGSSGVGRVCGGPAQYLLRLQMIDTFMTCMYVCVQAASFLFVFVLASCPAWG